MLAKSHKRGAREFKGGAMSAQRAMASDSRRAISPKMSSTTSSQLARRACSRGVSPSTSFRDKSLTGRRREMVSADQWAKL